MRRYFSLLVLCAWMTTARAETNLFTGGAWVVLGTPSADTNDLQFVRNKHVGGFFSTLEFSYRFDGTNAVPVFSLSATGDFQPLVPVPGGVFQLGSYRDCAQGLVDPLALTKVTLAKNPIVKGRLQLTGTLANRTSLRGERVTITLFPAQTNAVRVDIDGKITATRALCVDLGRRAEQDDFRVVTMLSDSNDLARYVKITERICVPLGFFTSCYTRRRSVCAALTNQTGYVFHDPHTLGRDQLLLAQTNGETPNLTVAFQSPKAGQIKPQGLVSNTNVAVWGNWEKAKATYRAGKTVLRLRCSLEATAPSRPDCDDGP